MNTKERVSILIFYVDNSTHNKHNTRENLSDDNYLIPRGQMRPSRYDSAGDFTVKRGSTAAAFLDLVMALAWISSCFDGVGTAGLGGWRGDQ
jgi:hypothetical protein